MNVVENSVIIPVFAMVVVAFVLFNLTLHERITTKCREYRIEYRDNFNNEKGRPQEALRAYWAVEQVIGKE